MFGFTNLAAFVALLSSILAAPLDSAPLEKRYNSAAHVVHYVQTFHNENSSTTNLTLLPLYKQNTRITHINLAAIHINAGTPNDLHLNDNNPNSSYYDFLWPQVAKVQAAGIKVLFMMGGAAPGTYDTICTNSGAINFTYYEPLRYTISYHKIQGIDLDIEQDTPIACAQNLIKQFKSDFGKSFLVTMAPVGTDMIANGGGLSGFNYKTLDGTAAGKMVDWYNVQYYSGFLDGNITNTYMEAISNGFSPTRIIMGVLDNDNDGDGWVPLSSLKSDIKVLLAKYSNFGGAFGWEYFNAGQTDGLPQPWQWTKAIATAIFGPASSSSAKTAEIVAPAASVEIDYIPARVRFLMAEGYEQISAARALRRAHNDMAKARELLETGKA